MKCGEILPFRLFMVIMSPSLSPSSSAVPLWLMSLPRKSGPEETCADLALHRRCCCDPSGGRQEDFLICERPKIGPLRDIMRARIAEITGLNISRVAVKATTSERLGFTGREEGIAATASATIRLPWGDMGWSD